MFDQCSSWNEEDINLARADADRNIENWVFHVYGASKAESERAGWKFVKENNPGFVFNAGMFDRAQPNLSID